MKYTVLLLVPSDYWNEQYNPTYQAWVKASSPVKAAKAAMKEATHDNNNEPDDYKVLAVYEGHHRDLSEEYNGRQAI